MRKVLIGFLAMGLCVLGLGAMWIVRADDDDTVKFTAKLDGFQELGALNNETGAILSDGKGTLTLILDKGAPKLTYTLTYKFPSTTPTATGSTATMVTQSHIHFGKNHVPGNVMVFFCTNLNNGPAGVAVPPCPTFDGTVTGTIKPTAVKAVPTQGIVSAGDFDALVEALTFNTAYVNIHTAIFPAGEIRGQIRQEGRRRDRDRK